MLNEQQDDLIKRLEELTTELHALSVDSSQSGSALGFLVAKVNGYKYTIRPKEQGHNLPHFHIEYHCFSASFDIDPIGLLAGSLPPGAEKVVKLWVDRNADLLRQAWNESRPTEYKSNRTTYN